MLEKIRQMQANGKISFAEYITFVSMCYEAMGNFQSFKKAYGTICADILKHMVEKMNSDTQS